MVMFYFDNKAMKTFIDYLWLQTLYTCNICCMQNQLTSLYHKFVAIKMWLFLMKLHLDVRDLSKFCNVLTIDE